MSAPIFAGTCGLAAGTAHDHPRDRECGQPVVAIVRDAGGTHLGACAEHADHVGACLVCRAGGVTVACRLAVGAR